MLMFKHFAVKYTSTDLKGNFIVKKKRTPAGTQGSENRRKKEEINKVEWENLKENGNWEVKRRDWQGRDWKL